jgi:diaminopimelate epimerase
MTLTFYKYQGTGNDFIIIDGRNVDHGLSNLVIKKLCDRKFGIGADGLMLLKNQEGYDFSMTYFNADGNEGSMCGNGGRCIIAFAQQIGIGKNKLKFIAVDGPHEGEIIKQIKEVALVRLKMADVSEFSTHPDHYLLETGSPHYVEFTENVNTKNVYADGKAIRNNNQFIEEGINVNFVEESQNKLFVRTFERGVENETLSCGTGVTASVIAFALKNNLTKESIQIQTLGGNLKVNFEKTENVFKNVWLEGPATFVFKGEIEI